MAEVQEKKKFLTTQEEKNKNKDHKEDELRAQMRSADLLDKSQRLEEWFELKDQGAGEADGQDTERRFIVLATSPATKESRGD